jgi:hypothetical protein
MPFESKRQQRAAFGGHIPGISKTKAKEWAKKTDFARLPERAPAEKGKPTLLSKKASGDMQYFRDHPEKLKEKRERDKKAGVASFLRRRRILKDFKKAFGDQVEQPGTQKNVFDTYQREKESALAELFSKLAYALPGPGQVRSAAQSVGKFRGMASQNFLKPPGPAASRHVINPRLSVANTLKTRV